MAAYSGFLLAVFIFVKAGVLLVSCECVEKEAVQDDLPANCSASDIPKLKLDTAHLNVQNDGRETELVLYMQSAECDGCPIKPVKKVHSNCTVLVDTRWPVHIEIRRLTNPKASPSCSAAKLTQLFHEGGEYFLYIQQNGTPNAPIKCSDIILMNSPSDAYIPIYVALAIAVCCGIMWVILKKLYRMGIIHRLAFWSIENSMADLGTPTSINPTEDNGGTGEGAGDATAKVKKERLRSLDTFRGMSLVIMIFVNYHGGYYWFFRHSKWNGLTVADLVFPWFVYIMGTAMMLSFQAQLRRGVPKSSMFLKIIRRSITLFALGLLVNSGGSSAGVDLNTFRIPGVLQRFAGTYLIVASVHLLFAKPFDASRYGRFAIVRDITDFWPEWVVQLTLVAVHTGITFGLHVPGCPTGYLGAGGDAENGSHINCTGGAAGYVDRKIFGDSHIYQHPTCKEIYDTVVPYDPEGLLGTLTSCFICFLGLQAGKILFIHKDWVQRSVRFAVWGVALGLIAGILCKFSKNDGWIPVNKNLWSLSFVTALAGMGFILLMCCYLLIDVYKVWNGAPFYYPGMNSILLYVGHELLSGRFPVAFDVRDTHGAQLAMNLWGACFWCIVAFYLYVKGIFITV